MQVSQMGRTKTEHYDWLIKLIIIGDSGVGKTNILNKFTDS